MAERTVEVDGYDVAVTVENGEAEAEIDFQSPHDVDGETFTYKGEKFEVKVLMSAVHIIHADSGAKLHIIERNGWELDAYVLYAGMPYGLAKELKALGFGYESRVEPMRELGP